MYYINNVPFPHIAVMYSGFGVILSWLRGVDDEVNTIAAGTATGLLYKSSGKTKILFKVLVCIYVG